MHISPKIVKFNRCTWIVITSLVLNPFFIFSQKHNAKENIINKIETESGGNIVIDIPPTILELILTSTTPKPSVQDIKPGINKVSGYRIQVFSDGRNQHTLEARAKARGSAILAKFPKYRGQIYTYSSSPNWYTRVGNFRSLNEANTALNELKSAFPNFSSEMRVVKCQIVIIK